MEIFHPGFLRKLESTLALRKFKGSTFCAGALFAGRATATYLNGRERTDTLGAVVVRTAGNRTLDVVVGVHTIVHGKTLLLKSLRLLWLNRKKVMPVSFFLFCGVLDRSEMLMHKMEQRGGELEWICVAIKLP